MEHPPRAAGARRKPAIEVMSAMPSGTPPVALALQRTAAAAVAVSASAAAAVHASAEASDDAFAAVVAAEAAVVAAGKGEVQSQQNARVPAAAGAEVGKLMQT